VFYRLTLATIIFLTQAFIRPIKTSCGKAIGRIIGHLTFFFQIDLINEEKQDARFGIVPACLTAESSRKWNGVLGESLITEIEIIIPKGSPKHACNAADTGAQHPP
jgi:hypothetical protein